MFARLIAKAAVVPPRKPIVKTPEDYGMSYRDVNFRSEDGVDLKGWYIPADGDRLIIFTHPMPFNRYGFTTKGQGLMKVSDVEVELLKVVKRLHDAGYGVLTFDFRNHGESGGAHDGVCTVGYEESRDVVAAKRFVAADPELSTKRVGMVINCMGANAALMAMAQEPELFSDVASVVAIQQVSYGQFLDHYIADKMPLVKRWSSQIKAAASDIAGMDVEQMTPINAVAKITAPILYVQVREDAWTDPSDVQSFYDATLAERDLLWIEGDLERFDGYNYFAEKPDRMLEWLDRYLETSA